MLCHKPSPSELFWMLDEECKQISCCCKFDFNCIQNVSLKVKRSQLPRCIVVCSLDAQGANKFACYSHQHLFRIVHPFCSARQENNQVRMSALYFYGGLAYALSYASTRAETAIGTSTTLHLPLYRHFTLH
jgi:hypothetical protein